MRDDFLRQIITDNVSGNVRKIKTSGIAVLAFSIGFAVAAGFHSYASNGPSDDDLAKLAELAACSTGEPASSLWLQAQSDNAWGFVGDRYKVAKRFLVDIDIDRCGIRETANAQIDQREIGTFSPRDRYN
ncbi:hypothetical protein FIV06_09210 [Labrenzia sp. THAF191b]|nr:hypothetical protein FIV06_09210 [Labrenzia sp. THAF191b]QFT03914.1 hypothetical protein FIV05_09210 [Labrenzia sp. THAF191a]QFT15456.1 hypothetical protein FIV03_09215 [Labrenzia sp. THAF187b]